MKYIDITSFKLPIYQHSIDNWQETKVKLLDIKERLANYFIDSEEVGIELLTTFGVPESEGYSKLVLETTEVLRSPITLFCSTSGYDLALGQLWYQTYRKNAFHGIHNHGVGYISAILFLEFDENEHKAPVFVAPQVNFITGEIIDYENDVKEGDILFFPSTLVHHIPPNTSDKIRTVIAMNLKVISDVHVKGRKI